MYASRLGYAVFIVTAIGKCPQVALWVVGYVYGEGGACTPATGLGIGNCIRATRVYLNGWAGIVIAPGVACTANRADNIQLDRVRVATYNV